MADPLTIIGGVASICNIIDATTIAISTLNGLRKRWATADLVTLTLASQLMALRAALSNIQTWMERSHPEALHYQAIISLDISIRGCQLLVNKLETFLSGLDTFADRPLDFSHRLRVAFGHRRLDDIEKLLQQQTSALTLLLTALNCTTLSKQERSLRKLHSLKRIEQVKRDSASLFGLRDSDSFQSKWSGRSSRFSMEFDFDPEIFLSGVYYRAFSSHARRAWKRPRQSQPKPIRVFRVLLLGDDEVGKDRLVNKIHETYLQQCTAKDIVSCRQSRLKICLDQTRTLVRVISQVTRSCLQEVEASDQSLQLECSTEFGSDTAYEKRILEAMMSIWQKAATMPLPSFGLPELTSMASPQYFMQEIKKLKSPDLFPPTAADFLKSQAKHQAHEATCAIQQYMSVDKASISTRTGQSFQMTVRRIPDQLHYVAADLAKDLEAVDVAFMVIDLTRHGQSVRRNLDLLLSVARLSRVRRKRYDAVELRLLIKNLDSCQLSELPRQGYTSDLNACNTCAEFFANIASICGKTSHGRLRVRAMRFQEDSAADLIAMIGDFSELWVHRNLQEGFL